MSTTDDNNDGINEEITDNKEDCTSCEQNNVDAITEGIDSVAIDNGIETCAACGKEGDSDEMNVCNKCKMVKYCNVTCKKKHRKKHKKACEKRVAELYEEALFKEIEPEECPICMLTLPFDVDQSSFFSCCGKIICDGCVYAMRLSKGKDLCAFCRTPISSSDEEIIRQTKKLMEKGNAEAFYYHAIHFQRGIHGMPRDWVKANGLYLKAGELGHAPGYHALGKSYAHGSGVEVDKKKAKHYYELAVMNGSVQATYELAALEHRQAIANEHYERAKKLYTIAAKAGHEESLELVKKGFMTGVYTKDEYAYTLRAYQKRRDVMKSDERDEAAKVLAALHLRRSQFFS